MQRNLLIKPIARTTVVLMLLVLLLTGITYAALQSQTKIMSSNITTTTANMLISSDNVTFGSTLSGFSFGEIVPGGGPMPATGYSLYLKNTGGASLAPKFAISSTPTNPANVDLSKVTVTLTATSSSQVQSFTLQSLIDSHATGGLAITSLPALFPGQKYQFSMQASMMEDAFVGTSASIGAIDFVLTGTAVN